MNTHEAATVRCQAGGGRQRATRHCGSPSQTLPSRGGHRKRRRKSPRDAAPRPGMQRAGRGSAAARPAGFPPPRVAAMPTRQRVRSRLPVDSHAQHHRLLHESLRCGAPSARWAGRATTHRGSAAAREVQVPVRCWQLCRPRLDARRVSRRQLDAPPAKQPTEQPADPGRLASRASTPGVCPSLARDLLHCRTAASTSPAQMWHSVAACSRPAAAGGRKQAGQGGRAVAPAQCAQQQRRQERAHAPALPLQRMFGHASALPPRALLGEESMVPRAGATLAKSLARQRAAGSLLKALHGKGSSRAPPNAPPPPRSPPALSRAASAASSVSNWSYGAEVRMAARVSRHAAGGRATMKAAPTRVGCSAASGVGQSQGAGLEGRLAALCVHVSMGGGKRAWKALQAPICTAHEQAHAPCCRPALLPAPATAEPPVWCTTEGALAPRGGPAPPSPCQSPLSTLCSMRMKGRGCAAMNALRALSHSSPPTTEATTMASAWRLACTAGAAGRSLPASCPRRPHRKRWRRATTGAFRIGEARARQRDQAMQAQQMHLTEDRCSAGVARARRARARGEGKLHHHMRQGALPHR